MPKASIIKKFKPCDTCGGRDHYKANGQCVNCHRAESKSSDAEKNRKYEEANRQRQYGVQDFSLWKCKPGPFEQNPYSAGRL